MCGIVGILNVNSSTPINTSLLKQMNDAVQHRGPDAHGYHIDDDIGLGHRRLSIIDLEGGKQPLYNEDENVVVVFNGEIYNYQEIKVVLEDKGHKFKTNSDTEVIVHSWEEWGEDCVNKFRGMFSFSVWDRVNKILFAARDRLGIKPFHYTLTNDGRFLFASELKSILIDNNISKGMCVTAVEDYFSYGFIPDPKTIFNDIYKLPPGHSLLIRPGDTSVVTKQYWDIEFINDLDLNEEQIKKQLYDELIEAVNIRLISEVPIGAFLSGGVDSSVVVALMSELLEDAVKTCSISFENNDYDESVYSAEVAKLFKADHGSYQVASGEFNLIDRLALIYDEPFADSSAIPTYKLCEITRQKVTVSLSGDGGDENFAGYNGFNLLWKLDKIRSLIPQKIRHYIFGSLSKIYPNISNAPKLFRLKTVFSNLAGDLSDSVARKVMISTENDRKELFTDEFSEKLNGYDSKSIFREYASKARIDHPLSLIQYLIIKIYLPGDILTKVDRASMAHSLEVRVPLLDHKLMEWVGRINPELKMKNNIGKYILKKTFESIIPNNILYRKKKGFELPFRHWINSELNQEIRNRLFHSSYLPENIFNKDAIRKILNKSENGNDEHDFLLWALLMFEAFYRLHEIKLE